MLAPSRSSSGIYQKNYDFSFSGLKTSVLYYLRDNPKTNKANIAASFQEAAIDVLTAKTFRAVNEFNARSIILCGGVAANKALRARLTKESKKLGVHPHTKRGSTSSPHGKNPRSGVGVKFFAPDFEFNTDNAAMIAAAAYMNYLRGRKYKLIAKGGMNI